MVGIGYTAREYCDGQSLASPGRWAVRQRQYPDTAQWKAVSSIFTEYAERHRTTELLMKLAVGRIEQCPFRELKKSTVEALKTYGLDLKSEPTDKKDVPIDFRYLGLLLSAADYPEVHLGSFAKGVR